MDSDTQLTKLYDGSWLSERIKPEDEIIEEKETEIDSEEIIKN